MLLRPRKFTHKNRQKKRSFFRSKINKLVYGQIGLKVLQPTRLFSKQMFRFKLFIKKGSRRSEKTYRKSWLIAFPHLPLTKKISGSRMGKGKGKLSDWVCTLPSGSNIVEFKNLRFGRGVYFCKQLAYKLPRKCRILHRYKQVDCAYSSSRKRMFETTW